ncbi:MAG: glycoside hydrolase family 16 protein [Myxococcota bacterium]|jgi:beta-glucanase (GH16 family)|nr:glycoside hydrolase family 16 protein [Myxococcota bacterium]
MIRALSVLSAALVPACATSGPKDTNSTPALEGWTLVWSDEFDGDAGEPPNPDIWVHDVGGHGWGNNQLEYNTDRLDNAQLDGEGMLWIRATEERYQNNEYTSARIKTEGLKDFGYGRLEARIRLPAGKGIWPAFWMLGSSFSTVGWPTCGEIDILELRGSQPQNLLGTLHGPGYSGGEGVGSHYTASSPLSEDFHVYAIERSEERIRWYLDDVLYGEKTPKDLPPGTDWVFDGPFFAILNVAVGGHFVEAPDSSTPFPALMGVDYLRFYEPEE